MDGNFLCPTGHCLSKASLGEGSLDMGCSRNGGKKGKPTKKANDEKGKKG